MRHAMLLPLLLSVGVAFAQTTPPEYLNYQGVLRDSADAPLDGPHDMVFRFYDAAGDVTCAGGTLLLIDSHEAAGAGAVDVSGGMFNVDLGGGSLSPGAASTLAEVFRDNAAVWLEPTVGGEKLCPRIRVLSSGYALNTSYLGGLKAGNVSGQIPISNGIRNQDLNADFLDGYTSSDFGRRAGVNGWSGQNEFTNSFNIFVGDGSGLTGVTSSDANLLDGRDSSYFLDTSSTAQTKLGTLSVDVTGGGVIPGISATSDFYGIDAQGNSAGGYFRGRGGSAYAYVGSGDTGVYAYGNDRGAAFSDLDNTGEADVAVGDYGIDARGNLAGGYFHDRNEVGYCYAGYAGMGIEAHGVQMGGLFVDDDGSGQANLASGDIGIVAYGNEQAGYFDDTDASGKALVAYGHLGIQGEGNTAGGYFRDLNSSGYAYIGHGDTGITASGDTDGGYFENTASSTWVRVANPYGDGIAAHGTNQGGFFQDDDSTGKAHVAYGDLGIEAEGSGAGGYFTDADDPGYAYVGYGDRGIYGVGGNGGGVFSSETLGTLPTTSGYGIRAYGSVAAGRFDRLNYTSESFSILAKGVYGIEAKGGMSGGYFTNNVSGGTAWVGDEAAGIYARGPVGGLFHDSDTSARADVADDTYKIEGTGSVNFVQNHPYDPSRVIVYAALEGDEVGTYTRGTGRIESGEARIPLGETFAWVTNPDLGLTAHVTSRGDVPVPLTVVDVTTSELVVRGPAGSDTAFDYLVMGLRIGFEATTVVQPKEKESYIPAMSNHRRMIADDPSLESHTALSRFRHMTSAVTGKAPDSLDFSRADGLRAAIHEYDPATDPPTSELLGHRGSPRRAAPETVPAPAGPDATPTEFDVRPNEPPATNAGSASNARIDPGRLFPVAGNVEEGDLLTFDLERPGLLVPAATAQDRGLVGIAAAAPVLVDGAPHVALVETNYAVVRADAGYGEIRPGDLLTTSFTSGHAMRSDDLVPGAIVGKALDLLATGTGRIKVLVMLR